MGGQRYIGMAPSIKLGTSKRGNSQCEKASPTFPARSTPALQETYCLDQVSKAQHLRRLKKYLAAERREEYEASAITFLNWASIRHIQ